MVLYLCRLFYLCFTCAVCKAPGAFVAHLYTYKPPRCRISQCLRIFIALLLSLWDDIADPVFDGVGLEGFKSRDITFLLGKLFVPHCFSLSLLPFCGLVF